MEVLVALPTVHAISYISAAAVSVPFLKGHPPSSAQQDLTALPNLAQLTRFWLHTVTAGKFSFIEVET